MPSLFVIQGRDQGQRFVLDGDELSLGRVSGNSVQVNDTEVSRKHAQLVRAGDGYVLRDLNSSNGTFVNGAAVRERRLQTGDRVQLGRTLLLYTGAHDSIVDAPGGVDIVSAATADEGARILHAMSQEEGNDFLATPPDQTQSPWLARARSNLQIMYRTALAVSHTLDIDQLLARIMEMIFEWVDADRGCILLKDPDTGELRARVRRRRRGLEPGDEPAPPLAGPSESGLGESATDDSGEFVIGAGDSVAMRSDERLAISKTILDYVMERGEGVLTSDAGDDSRWDPAKSIMRMGVREAICVPMRGRYELNGVIYIDTTLSPKELLQRRSANKFGEEHLKLMIAIAHQAALAVEDTSHYQAMVQAERLAAVGQTIATLSHHIKNILQGVRGGSYLIELGLGDHAKALAEPAPDLATAAKAVETVHKGWNIVEKNQERISSLVLDMLTYSKEREPEPRPSVLDEVVADVVELMRVRAAEAGVELLWTPAATAPTLLIDPEAVHRAVLNIVTNAIDACEGRDPARVQVATTLDEPPGAVSVVVRDTGVGIEKSQLGAIFTAFVSGKGSRGTGLGLAVTRKIAEEHGGKVLVESAPGVGSTFTLELPLRLAPSGAHGQEDVARPTLASLPSQRVGDDRPVTPTP